MGLFKKKKAFKAEKGRPVPQHIAIIMDGNGRWAQKRGLPRTAGHAAGCETFRRISNYCKKIGVRYFTVYAFSTENWRRSQEEVSAIMGLMEQYLREAIRDMQKNRVRICFFGDLRPLSPELRQLAEEAVAESSSFEIQANICLNYGGPGRDRPGGQGFRAGMRGGEGASGRLDGRAVFAKALFRRDPGPGSHHPAQRRNSDF